MPRSSGCRSSSARRSRRFTGSTAATSSCTARSGIRNEGRRRDLDFNKLTIRSQEAVAAAQELARRNGNPELYPEHLLLALLDQELPRQLVDDAASLRAEAEAQLAQKPRAAGAAQQPQVSAAVSRVLDRAFDEAKRMEDDYVAAQHLLLSL